MYLSEHCILPSLALVYDYAVSSTLIPIRIQPLTFPKRGVSLDLFDNSVSCLTSPAKYIVFCYFIRKLFGELKFPNNSIIPIEPTYCKERW